MPAPLCWDVTQSQVDPIDQSTETKAGSRPENAPQRLGNKDEPGRPTSRARPWRRRQASPGGCHLRGWPASVSLSLSLASPSHLHGLAYGLFNAVLPHRLPNSRRLASPPSAVWPLAPANLPARRLGLWVFCRVVVLTFVFPTLFLSLCVGRRICFSAMACAVSCIDATNRPPNGRRPRRLSTQDDKVAPSSCSSLFTALCLPCRALPRDSGVLFFSLHVRRFECHLLEREAAKHDKRRSSGGESRKTGASAGSRKRTRK